MKNRLEVLRTEKGWTQQELADRTGGPSARPSSPSRKGGTTRRFLLAFRLARQFGVAIEDLFCYSEEEDFNE